MVKREVSGHCSPQRAPIIFDNIAKENTLMLNENSCFEPLIMDESNFKNSIAPFNRFTSNLNSKLVEAEQGQKFSDFNNIGELIKCEDSILKKQKRQAAPYGKNHEKRKK